MGPDGPKWAQEDFFPANPDLADILGRTDLDFENFYFFDFLGSQISGFQGPRSQNSQIPGFPGSRPALLDHRGPFANLPVPCNSFDTWVRWDRVELRFESLSCVGVGGLKWRLREMS